MYSLVIILVQIFITSKPAMGLEAHHVERAIEHGIFVEILDPNVPDWPVEDALTLCRIRSPMCRIETKR